MDFSKELVQVYPKGKQLPVEHRQLKQMADDTQNSKPHVSVIAALSTDSSVMPGEYDFPDFGVPNPYKLCNCGGNFR